jgi:hypothetical protein
MGDTFGQGPGRKGLSGTGDEEVLERRNTSECKALIEAVFIVNCAVSYLIRCMK